MRKNPPSFSRACWTLVLLALTSSSPSVLAQSVSGFLLGKIQNFQQTSTAAPVANAAQPFQFGALVTAGTATINSATLTFSGTANPRAFTPVGNGDFSILETFATQALLDAAYQNGNFTVSPNTSDGNFSRTIFLFPFTYPTTPRLTVPAGDWQNNVLVLDPAQDYTFVWGAFSNAQTADVIQFAIRNSGVNLAPFPATQTSYLLPAGSLPPATDYIADLAFIRVAGATAGDTNIGPGYATLVRDTGFTVRTRAPALALSAAVSQKEHGSAGAFAIALPGVECRSGGVNGDHTLVFTFSNPVVSGAATIAAGSGQVAGPPVFSSNTMAVALTGVTNAQTVSVRLSNVTDSFAQVLPEITVSAGFLLGDTTGNGSVNASDFGQTKATSGQPLDAANFRADLNGSGSINASDVALAKSVAGTALSP